MNQFRRNNLKSRLPEKLKLLADNVSSKSQQLPGDNLRIRINQINNMNSALTQPFRYYQQNNGRYNKNSGCLYSNQQMTNELPSLPEELSSREKGSEATQQQTLQELKDVSRSNLNKFAAGNLEPFYLNWELITNGEIILENISINGLKRLILKKDPEILVSQKDNIVLKKKR